MKRLLITLLLFAGIGTMYAQFHPSRVTFGGGIGMQFGDYTVINIAPQIGYDVTSKMNLGAGLTYSHYSDKFDHDRYKESNDYFGFNIYGKFYPIPFTVLMLQPELTRMWQSVKNRSTGEKVTDEKVIASCLVGGGLRFGPVTAMLQYDLAQNDDSPYGNKLFYSVGYTFNF